MKLPKMTPKPAHVRIKRSPEGGDFGTSLDEENHMIFIIPGEIFLRLWKPMLADKEDLKAFICQMGGPMPSKILALDSKTNDKKTAVILTVHMRKNRESKICEECGKEFS